MQKEDILGCYREIAVVIQDASVGSPTRDSWLQIFIRAALTKCVEFNLISFDNAYDKSAFFNVSGLRGICEDFVVLKYFNEKIDRQDTQQIFHAWAVNQMAEGVKKQEVFFNENRPRQPVFSYVGKYESILKTSNQLLKNYRSKYGWNRKFPRIIDMADACSLRSLYDYLYCATSRFVHFSPHLFMRMGWGNIKTSDPSFRFSTTNFSTYYKEFSRFYGTILFVNFCEEFGGDLKISNLAASLVVLREYMEKSPRWPEFVTFEELNQTPPDYNKIYALTSLLEDFDTADLRAMVQVVLKGRLREKIGRLSLEEKRDSVHDFFGGAIFDEVASLSEHHLDRVLNALGTHQIEQVKPDIRTESVARFFSTLPVEKLCRYLRSISNDDADAKSEPAQSFPIGDPYS